MAQAEGKKRFEKIEAIKVAYITKELNLSAEESQKFWPLYNRYFEEIREARRSHRDDELAFEEQALNIRKKYKPEFQKVLNDEQRVNRIFTVERSYRELLRRELMNRQQGQKKAKKQ